MARDPACIPEATLRLHLARGVGPVTIRRLEEHFGSHDAVLAASVAELAAVEGVGPGQASAIRAALEETDPRREREAMEAAGARLVVLGEPDYPPLVSTIDDPPPALWVQGRLEPQDRLAIAIVGSRRCTAYGREQAARLSSLLAQCGITIVSGGALGIDGEAHRGALRVGGRTLAVMGCGLGRVYPPEHSGLFERIRAGGGALLSAYPMDVEPRPHHFPRRNRIIAGLAVGVLVVEAARRSGALITAREAGREGREVMALPGRVDSPASAGCLLAIREGWAALVTNHVEILEQLDASSHLVRGALEQAGHPDARRASLFDGPLSTGQQRILDALCDGGSLTVDQVAARAGLPIGRVFADITLLQVRGRIDRDGTGLRLRSRARHAEGDPSSAGPTRPTPARDDRSPP